MSNKNPRISKFDSAQVVELRRIITEILSQIDITELLGVAVSGLEDQELLVYSEELLAFTNQKKPYKIIDPSSSLQAYTVSFEDFGKVLLSRTNGAQELIIPADASEDLPLGFFCTFFNDTGSAIGITLATEELVIPNGKTASVRDGGVVELVKFRDAVPGSGILAGWYVTGDLVDAT